MEKQDQINCAVVIPIYREIAEPNEKLSFWQCIEVLGRHPIILVVPQSLNTTYYEALVAVPMLVERFPDEFFKNVASYSKLLLSASFYDRFLQHEYILLYQLDAWVFRDELAYWVAKQYDYIGAPWLEAPPIPSNRKPIINLSRRLARKVGNGGLSLRKVSSHIKWSPWVRFIFYFLPKNEDMIWTLFVPFKKPQAEEALHFAFERLPRKSFELTNRQLPFGCHAWQKYQYDFWQHYIP